METNAKKIKHSRFNSAVRAVLISIIVNAFLALCFAGISAAKREPFLPMFVIAFKGCYLLFGGSFLIDAILMLTTKIPEKAASNYGMGFYYATMVLWYFLTEYLQLYNFELALILAAIIAGLVCYIFWLKQNKE